MSLQLNDLVLKVRVAVVERLLVCENVQDLAILADEVSVGDAEGLGL